MQMSKEVIQSEIEKCSWILFDKKEVLAFLTEQADPALMNTLFDDLFAFNAYLGRIEAYPSFDKIPFWEYSTSLQWCESHMMVGDSFDLTLRNARRFLGSIKSYFTYLTTKGSHVDCTEIDKAHKTICGGKKLKLVTEIPYTGTETYTEIFKGGVGIRFDIADYWLLILHATIFNDSWPKLLEAALGISQERVKKTKELQAKMKSAGYKGLSDIAFNDVMESDVEQASKWFYKK
jgi:hypothetical protein